MPREVQDATSKHERSYWFRRMELEYYQYVINIVSKLVADANSIIDVGSADTPILEYFKWLPERYALDKRNPYSSKNVTGIKADFLKYEAQKRFDIALCLQVLEHIPDVETFARKLFEIADHVIISVPYNWDAESSKHHLHDPVDLEKLCNWTGRDPSYYVVVQESSSSKRRLICYYHPEGKEIDLDSLSKGCRFKNKSVYSYLKHKLNHIFRNVNVFMHRGTYYVINKNLPFVLPFVNFKVKKHVGLAKKAMLNNSWPDAVVHWENALKYRGNSLLNDPGIFRSLARCYMKLGKTEQVARNMQIYLELNFDIELQDIIFKIKREIGLNTDYIKSSYHNIGGRGNLGFIEHTWKKSNNGKKYLTKITRETSRNTQKEKMFYLEICERFPALQKIIPQLINITTLRENDLCFLTMEKIIGRQPHEKKHMKDIVDAQKILASIKYTDVINLMDKNDVNPGFSLNDLNSSAGKRARNTFATIHKASVNEETINWLYQKANLFNCSAETVGLVKKLEYFMLDLKLYEKLRPEENYVLLHGDFGRNNMLVDEEKGRLYLYDWSSYLAGPVGFDMAFYFRKRRWPFKKVEKMFLSNPEYSGYLKDIEKVFFLYALLVLWFMEDVTDRVVEGDYYDYINPVLKRIEELCPR